MTSATNSYVFDKNHNEELIKSCFEQLNKCSNLNTIPEEWKRFVEKEELQERTIRNYNSTHYPTKRIVNRRRETYYEELWKKKRVNEQKTSQINIHHNCFREDCHNDGLIKKVHPKENIFQCEVSGKVHICSKQGFCDLMINTPEGNVCYFSGVCDNRPELIRSIEEKNNEVSQIKVPSETNSSFLNRKGSLLPGPRVKKYGVPSARNVRYHCEKTQKHSSSTQSQPNTPRGSQRKSPKKRRSHQRAPDFRSTFFQILDNLLFDREKREEVNQKNIENSIDKWLTSRNRTSEETMNVIDALNYVIHSTTGTELSLVEGKENSTNEKKIEFYLGICEILWKFACKGETFKENVVNDNNMFIIAFLYLLIDCRIREGEGDTLITQNLPNQYDLSRYWKKKFGKNYVIDSKKIFKEAFKEVSAKDTARARINIGKIRMEVERAYREGLGSFRFVNNFSSVILSE